MTNDEINQYIHVEIMDKCWHEDGFMPHKEHPYPLSTCERCGFTLGSVQAAKREGVTPDYCSDDSPRRLLNEVVDKMRITGGWMLTLMNWHYHGKTTYTAKLRNSDLVNKEIEIRADTPEIAIATACVEAHKALNTKTPAS